MPDDWWVIRESDADTDPLYWRIGHGWGHLDDADFFQAFEKDRVMLPVGAEWERHE